MRPFVSPFKPSLLSLIPLALLFPFALPSPSPADAPVLSPMMQEIAEVLAAEKEQLAALELRLAALPGTEVQQELVRQMQELKTSTEIRILEIQLHHARLQGHDATVQELERVIEALRNPRPVGERQTRPRPEPTNR